MFEEFGCGVFCCGMSFLFDGGFFYEGVMGLFFYVKCVFWMLEILVCRVDDGKMFENRHDFLI